MDLRGSIPTFVMLTPGKVNDARMMDKIPVEAGAFYLMDRGYVAFEKLYKHFQQKGAYFVTRAKDNMSYEVIESRPVNKDSGVLSDETIRLAGYYSTRKYPDTLRLVVYEDFETGRVYRFLTNNFAIDDPLTIAELYRERWQIELFFKWIKQHLHIRTFYGTSKNAVYTQIWIAICDYLLLIIAKKRYGLDPSLHSISNSIGQVLFQRADIREIYNQPTTPVCVPEAGSVEQPTLWQNFSGQQCCGISENIQSIFSRYGVRIGRGIFCPLFLVCTYNRKLAERLFLLINGMDAGGTCRHVHLYVQWGWAVAVRYSAAGYGMDGHLRHIVPESFVAGAFV